MLQEATAEQQVNPLSQGSEAEAVLEELRSNYPMYAEQCLKIKTKKGEIVPFVFNRVQEYTHRKLEEQLERAGKVRALILKGRQLGISTYVGGRFYHKVSLNHGLGVYILTHEQDATETLLNMLER